MFSAYESSRAKRRSENNKQRNWNVIFYVSGSEQSGAACKFRRESRNKSPWRNVAHKVHCEHVEMSIKFMNGKSKASVSLQVLKHRALQVEGEHTKKNIKIMKVGCYMLRIFPLHVSSRDAFYDISHVADTLFPIPSALTDIFPFVKSSIFHIQLCSLRHPLDTYSHWFSFNINLAVVKASEEFIWFRAENSVKVDANKRCQRSIIVDAR